MVEVDGRLTRACAVVLTADAAVLTESPAAQAARLEASDRILANHELYCTVCDNNNGNCTVHNTTSLLKIEHPSRPYKPKPFAVGMSNPFYRL